MSFKKILVSSVACVAAVAMTSSVAGGNDADAQVVPQSVAALYLGADLGYAHQNYKDDAAWRHNTTLESGPNSHNITGGFAGAGYLGYQLNNHYAFELGYTYLPEVNVNASAPNAWMTNWALYLAAKYMMPLCQKLKGDVFFKLGVAYRELTVPSSASFSGNISSRQSDYVRPMFAVGYERTLFADLFVNGQYAYYMGANNSFPLTTTTQGALGTIAANVFTLGLAYHFVL